MMSPDGNRFYFKLATPGLSCDFAARNSAAGWAHPVFSADGKRIYFNVNADKWTRLFVAEQRKS